jgi:spermidine/putrescine transport system permease protein
MTAIVRRHALTAYALVAFGYLLLPIAVVIAFSFNDPAGRFNYTWQGFTLDNWRNWDAVPGLSDSMILSLEIAALASVVAVRLASTAIRSEVSSASRSPGTASQSTQLSSVKPCQT